MTSTGTRSPRSSGTTRTRCGSGCATRRRSGTTSSYDFWVLTRFHDIEAREQGPRDVQLQPRHHGRDDDRGTGRRHRHDHLDRPAQAHHAPEARVACVHVAARVGARGPRPRGLRRAPRPARGRAGVRLRAGLLGDPPADDDLDAPRRAREGPRLPAPRRRRHLPPRRRCGRHGQRGVDEGTHGDEPVPVRRVRGPEAAPA